jgi:hypothetical protein
MRPKISLKKHNVEVVPTCIRETSTRHGLPEGPGALIQTHQTHATDLPTNQERKGFMSSQSASWQFSAGKTPCWDSHDDSLIVKAPNFPGLQFRGSG